MVIILLAQLAVTPGGKPFAIPIPCVPVVECVIAVNALLIHKVGVAEAALAVLFGFTVMVPVAVILPQPPVSGML
jgi:hypothetical protein